MLIAVRAEQKSLTRVKFTSGVNVKRRKKEKVKKNLARVVKISLMTSFLRLILGDVDGVP